MGRGGFPSHTAYIMGLWSCLVRKGRDTFEDLFSHAASRKDGVDRGQPSVEGLG